MEMSLSTLHILGWVKKQFLLSLTPIKRSNITLNIPF